MRIFAFETSCDETASAVVEDGRVVQSNVIATSKHAFEHAGGVIPEEAARKQIECILPVLHQALDEADTSWENIDALAVTYGPGLLGSLLVGTVTGRVIASLHAKPLIGIHHTFGHLSSTWLGVLEEPSFPIITLSASGGHTDLWFRCAHTEGTLLGCTRDDAAGEAFDKGASLLGLPYPGGPSIARAAEKGNGASFDFPLPLEHENTLDFSFSGLKTALKYLLRDIGPSWKETRADIAASFQHAICRQLVLRIQKALDRYPEAREVHIVGGVSANLHLRTLLTHSCPDRTLRWPTSIAYCTDNAAMIAAAAFFLMQERGDHAHAAFMTNASLPLQDFLRTIRNSKVPEGARPE